MPPIAPITATDCRCLLCQVDGRLLAVPSTATIRVDDPRVEPPFPACAPWLGGFALLADGSILASLRLVPGPRRSAPATVRGVLLDCGPGLRCLIEIDNVLRLAELAPATGPDDGFAAPPGWLVAASTRNDGHVALVDPAAIARDLFDPTRTGAAA